MVFYFIWIAISAIIFSKVGLSFDGGRYGPKGAERVLIGIGSIFLGFFLTCVISAFMGL